MAKLVHLSEASSLAIHAMVLIAQQEGNVNVKNLAERMGASRNHLAKVLQQLVKQRFLTSLRGPSGGFALGVPASGITLLQIYEAIEGAIDVPECPLDRPICPFNRCLMGGLVADVTMQFKEHFSSMTLEAFITESV